MRSLRGGSRRFGTRLRREEQSDSKEQEQEAGIQACRIRARFKRMECPSSLPLRGLTSLPRRLSPRPTVSKTFGKGQVCRIVILVRLLERRLDQTLVLEIAHRAVGRTRYWAPRAAMARALLVLAETRPSSWTSTLPQVPLLLPTIKGRWVEQVVAPSRGRGRRVSGFLLRLRRTIHRQYPALEPTPMPLHPVFLPSVPMCARGPSTTTVGRCPGLAASG